MITKNNFPNFLSGGDDATHIWSWPSIVKGTPLLLGDLKSPKNVLGLFNETIETNGLSVDPFQKVRSLTHGSSNLLILDRLFIQLLETLMHMLGIFKDNNALKPFQDIQNIYIVRITKIDI